MSNCSYAIYSSHIRKRRTSQHETCTCHYFYHLRLIASISFLNPSSFEIFKHSLLFKKTGKHVPRSASASRTTGMYFVCFGSSRISERISPDSYPAPLVRAFALLALNNEVFLNTPLDFDDVYDSDINISFEDYSRDRLMYYGSLCGCDLADCKEFSEMTHRLSLVLFQACSSGKSMLSVFNTEALSQMAKLTVEHFTLCIENALLKNTEWNNAIALAIQIEYNDLIQDIRNTFRISCFTTTPFSQRMWGSSYADNHRGFCIEYQVMPDDPKYEQIINNLFPVIYCKKRSDVEKKLIHWQDELSEESVWSIYSHGVLRKSIDWGDQNEWRLLLPGTHKQGGFTVPFFPISKVYLGNRMDHQHRKELIDICHSRNIPYVGVSRASNWYEMQECSVLCENCSNYLAFINRKEQL